MKLIILVEGKSEQTFLEKWLPRFIPQHGIQVIPHRGKGRLPNNPNTPRDSRKRGLLDQLPMKLRAYGKTLNPEIERLLILVDQDDDDCHELKRRIQTALENCNPRPFAMVRIATKEMEAFFLGDKAAIRSAFRRPNKRKLESCDPEEGTWETFAEIIHDTSGDKVKWAGQIADFMKVDRPYPKENKSISFRHFCKAVLRLVGEPY